MAVPQPQGSKFGCRDFQVKHLIVLLIYKKVFCFWIIGLSIWLVFCCKSLDKNSLLSLL